MYEYKIKLSISPSCRKEFTTDVELVNYVSPSYIGSTLGAVLGLAPTDAVWGLSTYSEPLGASFNETQTTLVFEENGQTVPIIGSETEVTTIPLELDYESASSTPLVIRCNDKKILHSGLEKGRDFFYFTVGEWKRVTDYTQDGLKEMFYRAVSFAMQEPVATQPSSLTENSLSTKKERELPLHGTDEEHIVHPPVPKAPARKEPETDKKWVDAKVPRSLPSKDEAYKAALDAASRLDIRMVHAMLLAAGIIQPQLTVFELYRMVMIRAIDAIDTWYEKKGEKTVIPFKHDDDAPTVFYIRMVDLFGKWAMQVEFVPSIGSATFYE